MKNHGNGISLQIRVKAYSKVDWENLYFVCFADQMKNVVFEKLISAPHIIGIIIIVI